MTKQSIEDIKAQLIVVDWPTLLEWLDPSKFEGILCIPEGLDMAGMIYEMMYSDEDGFFEDWLHMGKIAFIESTYFDNHAVVLVASIEPFAIVQLMPVDMEWIEEQHFNEDESDES